MRNGELAMDFVVILVPARFSLLVAVGMTSPGITVGLLCCMLGLLALGFLTCSKKSP